METTRHLVALGPVAVELVDNNVLVARRRHPALPADARRRSPRAQPNCLLLVEFAGEDRGALLGDLKRLDQCMADHGFPDAVVEVVDAGARSGRSGRCARPASTS